MGVGKSLCQNPPSEWATQNICMYFSVQSPCLTLTAPLVDLEADCEMDLGQTRLLSSAKLPVNSSHFVN